MILILTLLFNLLVTPIPTIIDDTPEPFVSIQVIDDGPEPFVKIIDDDPEPFVSIGIIDDTPEPF